jgi:hypothetical protein
MTHPVVSFTKSLGRRGVEAPQQTVQPRLPRHLIEAFEHPDVVRHLAIDHALLALSFYRDGGDWTSGKIAMRSPRTEPSQSSLAT